MQARIGIIGGSGLYDMPGFTAHEEKWLDTPLGKPSDAYIVGSLEGRTVAFLARHARGHRLLPSELNFRANIYGFKLLGVEAILSLSAVGSLKEEHRPLEFLLPDQFFDCTRGRVSTFFGNGLVAHIGFDHPVCEALAGLIHQSALEAGVPSKIGGTYLCMEGPAFSTKAESNVYRSWGMDVIGMTNLQEAKLAREAEIAYATIAMITDYDCWHPSHDAVTVEAILDNLKHNADNAVKLVRQTVRNFPDQFQSKAHSALKNALMTQWDLVPQETLEKLWPIVAKYFPEQPR